MSLLKIGNLNNEDQYFQIDYANALKLELAFNLSDKGKEWKELGDHLYNYSIQKEVELNWKIPKDQFHYLRNLANENGIEKK